MHRVLYLLLLLPMLACTGSPDPSRLDSAPTPVPETVAEPVVEPLSTNPTDASGLPVADIDAVAVTGEAGNYTFAVTISSADTGCEQYSDWWEVVDAQSGDLIYRRILAHSHVNEQPFTRSGGPVAIEPDQRVVIRGHMGGLQSHYGGQALGGSVESGFQPVEDSLPSLETVEPLPKGCAF
ncbi:hypothetical protein U2F10_28625 [Leptothoe sp. EHU-05/26/07-4]|uniref:hypothetical protein n=1 Tax=Adonisia turfae TaxID=2950184 RepID=UPI002029ABC6|nr:hypothetical protein [Adonisia turfae]